MNREIDYISARLRARKSRLLGVERVRTLLGLSSLGDFVKMLAESRYHPYLSKLFHGEEVGFEGLNNAIGKALADEISQIRNFGQSLVETPCYCLFMWWDVENLKRVFRGLKSHESRDSILVTLFPVGWVEYPVWVELASSESVREGAERAQAMGVIPRSVMREGLDGKDYGEDELISMERALAKWFSETVADWFEGGYSSSFWGPLRESFSLSVDGSNLMALLDGVAWKRLPAEERLLPGGAYRADILLRKIKDAESPEALLADGVRKVMGAQGEEAATAVGSGYLARGKGLLGLALWRKQISRIKGDPLSSAILVGYLWARIAEAVDLKRIAGGIHFNIPSVMYDEMLITH